MVNAFVTMGKGHSAMEQHCMAMGMAGLSSPSFNSHLIKLTEENKLVRQHVLRNAHSAVRRAHMEVDSSISDSDVINIGVSYDGTWMKRGHTSKKAIIDNIPDVNKMKKAIYATLDHAMSTDDKPLHSRCPSGEKSWCFFNRPLRSKKLFEA
ncbi:hypothetical protein ANN_16585 [Periplaneta americana]|uniref:Mutator-like transposase domain-containing protein n=1 Tax=Periplaneta americana TaxID=6978 RepID=A0ABQ8SRC9_PERAM|nr:hypothetical protein ANN_16585 [Periplaneta americana]